MTENHALEYPVLPYNVFAHCSAPRTIKQVTRFFRTMSWHIAQHPALSNKLSRRAGWRVPWVPRPLRTYPHFNSRRKGQRGRHRGNSHDGGRRLLLLVSVRRGRRRRHHLCSRHGDMWRRHLRAQCAWLSTAAHAFATRTFPAPNRVS
jgi:hypothetical protein